MPKKDKYACFQWIRDVRAEMARDMEGMTSEQCSDYINRRYEESRKIRPRYTIEESRKFVDKYLDDPMALVRDSKAREALARKAAGRKPAKAKARA